MNTNRTIVGRRLVTPGLLFIGYFSPAALGFPPGEVKALAQKPTAPLGIWSGSLGLVDAAGVFAISEFYGNTRHQLGELVEQCGLPAIVDIGHGKWAPQDEEHNPPRPPADLMWPSFKARDPESDRVTIKDVLDAFFKERPGFRYRVDDSGLLWIEPSDVRRRTSALLDEKFPRPVEAVVDAARGWRIRARAVEEAAEALHPEWRKTRTQFSLWTGKRDIDKGPEYDAFPPRETKVSTLGEFARLWLVSAPNRYVVISVTHNSPERVEVGTLHGITVRLVEWNPERFRSSTEALVAGLKRDATVPAGWYDAKDWRRDCLREMSRRYLLKSDEVYEAIRSSTVLANADRYDRYDVGMFLMNLDLDRFGPHLIQAYWTEPRDVQRDMLGFLNWLPPREPYLGFWERLSRSDDIELSKIGADMLARKRREAGERTK